jgi:hypothetical protein
MVNLLGNLPGKTESAGGVFGIGDAEVEQMLFFQFRQEIGAGPAPGLAVDISDKKNFQAISVLRRLVLIINLTFTVRKIDPVQILACKSNLSAPSPPSGFP